MSLFHPKRLLVYVVASDDGMAPNIAGNICSLALCKPVVRRVAVPGEDWIVGMSTSTHGANRVIYVMPVERKLSYAIYAKKPEFYCKKPTKQQPNNDNIFVNSSSGLVVSPHAMHANRPDKLEKHLSSSYVLLSRRFWYFGASAPQLPEIFNETRLVQGARRGHKPIEEAETCRAFERWISRYSMGIQGSPRDL